LKRNRFRLAINCLVVAGLTLAGFYAMLFLPRFLVVDPLQWVDQYFNRPATMAFWFVYTVLTWAVFGAVIAWCMLFLKPRKVVLYGVASAAIYIVNAQSWYLVLHGSAFAYTRELVFIVTIPLLYWMFVRLAQWKQNPRLDTSDGIA